MLPQVIVVTGPTASGKTALAMALQDQLGGPGGARIISVDSAMIYRGMDIGTAKPAPALLAAYPHDLIDIRDPTEVYSAAEFVRDADRAVLDSIAVGQVPLLVGGTMLYLRCFRDGLADLPEADATVRAELGRELQDRGARSLHDELAVADPDAAAKIHPRNTQRLLRALEVLRVSGRPMSQFWQEQTDVRGRLAVDLKVVAVDVARARLHERIATRFDAMLAAGFVDEVSGLRARGDLGPLLPSMRAVGYRQAWQHLDGELDEAQLREKAVVATRRLAKRQLTWLRSWRDVSTIQLDDPHAAARQLVTQVLGR